ncbi:hypothetical protein [Iningainema tapete]|uniref:Uncharacterized protein n=1 Tax=Iningainema tapete BLCC-T55 TaxID=2748662 RepID=A0A8J7CBQ6_9CYAN|nr:hypothetical protein [Iningainema tapete]MBD2778621.1 hypothetical protein [Iningainema tapete BLCC-T55]
MAENQLESQTIDPTASTHEELLAAKEEIEFLRNLVESQNSHICHLEQKLLEVNQELEITNNELGMLLMSGVCFDEALVMTKTILKGEKSASKIVANLLTL